MPVEETTAATTQPTTAVATPSLQPAAEAPPAARVYTQAEVDAMVSDRERRAHDAGAAAARRALQGHTNGTRTATETTTATQSAPPPAASPTTSFDIARVVTFTTEANALGIPAKGVELLLSMMDVEKPPDVRAWLGQKADELGWRKTTTATTTTSTPTAATAVMQASTNVVPVTGNASPSNPATAMTDDVPLWRRSEDQRQQFIRDKGWPAFTARFTEEAMRDNVRLKLPR